VMLVRATRDRAGRQATMHRAGGFLAHAKHHRAQESEEEDDSAREGSASGHGRIGIVFGLDASGKSDIPEGELAGSRGWVGR
jgi:hypothetical protein